MKSAFALTAFWLCIGPLFAQKNYTPETLAKIRAVENNITGTLLLNDEGPSTIAQRMAKHKVKGMSIAVIQDYKRVSTMNRKEKRASRFLKAW